MYLKIVGALRTLGIAGNCSLAAVSVTTFSFTKIISWEAQIFAMFVLCQHQTEHFIFSSVFDSLKTVNEKNMICVRTDSVLQRVWVSFNFPKRISSFINSTIFWLAQNGDSIQNGK